jgi:hypothetical protein
MAALYPGASNEATVLLDFLQGAVEHFLWDGMGSCCGMTGHMPAHQDGGACTMDALTAEIRRMRARGRITMQAFTFTIDATGCVASVDVQAAVPFDTESWSVVCY